MIGKDRITNSRIKSTMHHRERRLPKLDMVQYPPILMNSIGRNVSNDMEGIATSNNNNKRGINRKKVRSIKESVRDADDEKRDSDKNKEGEDNANNSDKENNDDDDSDSDETSGSDSDASGGKRNRSRSRSSSSSSSSGSNHNGSESSESEDDKDAKKERKNDNDDTNSSSSSSSDNEDDDDNDKPRNVVQAPAVERNSSWLSLIHRSSGSATVEPDFKSAIKYGVPASVLVHIGLDKTSAILCGINILDLVRKGYIMDDLIVMGISLPDAIKMGLSTYKAFNECKRSIPISEMVTYWKLTCRDLLTHICNNRGPLYLKLDLTVEEHKLLGTSLKLLLKRKVTREMLITYQPIKLNQWKEVTGEELPF
jgi:hypothetical protein